ncbi:MAG: hypothetical protein PVG79_07630 [Gemmatimonadales bacterium]|jgi:hypothetical protein
MESDLETTDSGRTLRLAALAILALGTVLQFFLWSRGWVGEDQITLLGLGLEFAETGGLSPFAKAMTGGGRIPGSFLQLLVGIPLEIWPDYRAPALFIGISHLVAVVVLALTLVRALGPTSAVFFLAVYWLSPWRLHHSGVLWEPCFVFLPAAIHLACLYRLREQGRPVASAVLGATLVLTMQIHASFLILVVTAAVLLLKRKVRLSFWGAAAGVVAGSLTLIPTVLAYLRDELPGLAPARWEHLPPVALEVSNVLKAALYWFRLGSPDIGRGIRSAGQTAEGGLDVAVAVVAGLALASVAVSVVASWLYFRRSRRGGEPGADGREWVRHYVLSTLVAIGIVAVIAPAPVQGWHLVIALPAACIPVAAWLGANLLAGMRWRRLLAASFIVLQVVVTVVVGLGNPTYRRPSDRQAIEREIPRELYRLFDSVDLEEE